MTGSKFSILIRVIAFSYLVRDPTLWRAMFGRFTKPIQGKVMLEAWSGCQNIPQPPLRSPYRSAVAPSAFDRGRMPQAILPKLQTTSCCPGVFKHSFSGRVSQLNDKLVRLGEGRAERKVYLAM